MARAQNIFGFILTAAVFVGGSWYVSKQEVVYQWEFSEYGPSAYDHTQCWGMGKGTCLVAIMHVKRINGVMDLERYSHTYCWVCERGGNFACAGGTCVAWPGKVTKIERYLGLYIIENEQNWCDPVNDDTFKGKNVELFRLYLDYLVREYGQNVGLEQGDIRLRFDPGGPPESGAYVACGEIKEVPWPESWYGPDWEIIVYNNAHSNLSEVYNTIAEEFKHIVQCEEHGHGPEMTGPHIIEDEVEAGLWADSIAPTIFCR